MSARERLGLYPPIEPYRQGRLKVGGGHEIYFEECGNPGGQAGADHARRAGRRLQLDHAPLPRSGALPHRAVRPARLRPLAPHASLEANTTWDLVADIERLREHLGIERWQLFGGSWGSTLALAYAADPSRARQPSWCCAAFFCCGARSSTGSTRTAAAGCSRMPSRTFKQAIPAEEQRRHDRRLLPAPDPSRRDVQIGGGAGLVRLGGQHAVAAPGSRAGAAVRRRQLRHRLRAHRMPLLRQSRVLRADEQLLAGADAFVICPASSCTAATTW